MDQHGGMARTRLAGSAGSGTDAWSRAARRVRERAADLGLARPGRPATVTGVAISRFAEGRVVELWLQADLLGLLEQLEPLPPLDLARAVAMAQVGRLGALLAGAPPTAREPPRGP